MHLGAAGSPAQQPRREVEIGLFHDDIPIRLPKPGVGQIVTRFLFFSAGKLAVISHFNKVSCCAGDTLQGRLHVMPSLCHHICHATAPPRGCSPCASYHLLHFHLCYHLPLLGDDPVPTVLWRRVIKRAAPRRMKAADSLC